MSCHFNNNQSINYDRLELGNKRFGNNRKCFPVRENLMRYKQITINGDCHKNSRETITSGYGIIQIYSYYENLSHGK